jgi:ketosteroid isomerase-like protein
MSQENVEIVRHIYTVLDRGDDEAFWKLVAPDFVLDFSRRLIDPVVLRGRDQVQAWYDREGEMWEGGAHPLATGRADRRRGQGARVHPDGRSGEGERRRG